MDMTRGNFVCGAALGASALVAAGIAGTGTARAESTAVDAAAAGASAASEQVEADESFEFDYEFDGVKTKTVRIQSGENELIGTLQAPSSISERPTTIIFMLHGAKGTRKSDIFDNLGFALAKDGYAMARFDFHGHGDSEGEFGDSTVETNLLDMDQIVVWAKGLSWCNGLAIIGHSVGGAESAMYAARNPELFNAVMLISPALNIAETSSGILAGTAERLSYMSDAYVEDGSKFDVFEAIGGYDSPICIVHGTQDTAVSYEYSLRLFEMLDCCDLHLLAGAAHVPNDRIPEIYSIAKEFFGRTIAQ